MEGRTMNALGCWDLQGHQTRRGRERDPSRDLRVLPRLVWLELSAVQTDSWQGCHTDAVWASVRPLVPWLCNLCAIR